jgi:hypothetical protein
MAVDDGVYPFPIPSSLRSLNCEDLPSPDTGARKSGTVIPLHRMAQATRDAEMLEAIEQRLREGSPRSGARHVRLTDSVQVGENEFEDAHNIRADLLALAAGVVSALILVALSSCATPHPGDAPAFGSMTRLTPECKAAFQRGETQYLATDGLVHLCPLSKAPQAMRDQILGHAQ